MASYLCPAVVLVLTALIAAYVRHCLRAEKARRGLRVGVPLAILAVGSAGALFIFAWARNTEITTLHRVMLEGTLDWKEGEPFPVRETSFRVEHPGVEHELYFVPQTDGEEDFPVEVAVKLFDPAGQVVLEDRHRFIPEKGRNRDRGRGYSMSWRGRMLSFLPGQKETYRLQVTPLTAGVKGIYVRIADPEKTDGKMSWSDK
jgi:hypothetical protein